MSSEVLGVSGSPVKNSHADRLRITPCGPLEELAKGYLQAVLAREQRQARALIMDAVDRGASIHDIYLKVFQPVMCEIGEMWQRGTISVGLEHYCTNATQVTMSILYPRMFNGTRNGKRMLAACVEGELHELGLRMVADFFEMGGWNTDYLGANTPHDSIVSAIKEKSADVLAIGVTMHFHLEKAQRMIEAVRRAPGACNIKILVGGYAFNVNDALWQTLGADGSAANAREALVLAERLTTLAACRA